MWEKLNEIVISLLTKRQIRLQKKKDERRKKEDYAKNLIDSYHKKSIWVDITAPLTGLLTLMIYLSVGIVSADYKGERIIYIVTLIIEGILLAILLWEVICCLGNDGLKKLFGFIRSVSMQIIVLGAMIGLVYCCFISVPKTEYYSAIKEVYGIPTGIEGTKLEKEDLDNYAGYWEIIDKKNHMTLLYKDSYEQADFMQQYSTLYNMSLFQTPVRIEIDYKKNRDKDKYRSYGPEAFDAASENDFREPVKIKYYDASEKLLLELEKNNDGFFKIVTYSSKSAPQMLNSLLFLVPEGKVLESDLTSQQIEVTYNSAGLPEMRKFKSQINLYGVNGERYTYNENGQMSTLYFLDTDGMPVCNNLGIMTIDFQYNEEGNLQNIRYYSDEGKTEKTEGFYGVFCENFQYESGNLTERRQLGRNGSPSYDMNTVCNYRYVYKDGALAEEYFYGRNNLPVYVKMEQIHCCSVKFGKSVAGAEDMFSVSFDFRANQNDSVTTGLIQSLQKRIDNVKVSGKKQADNNNDDNEKGKEETNNNKPADDQILGLDKDMNSNPTDMTFQGSIGIYGDTGLTNDVDEEDIIPKYTSIYYKMKKGHITEMSYRDGNGLLTVNEQGCAIIRFEDCSEGEYRGIKEIYLNADGSECIIDEGYAAIETIYEDDKAEQIKYLKYLDTDDKLVKNKKTGYALIEYRYSNLENLEENIFLKQKAILKDQHIGKGKCIEECYLDQEEKAVFLHELGYSSIKRIYNENGFLIAEAYYDTSQQPAPTYRMDYGVAQISYEYSENGSLVCEQYFDVEGNPINRLDTGYARVYREFEMGRKVKEYYEGCREQTMCAVADKQTGAALITYSYNNGQKLEEAYFDINRNPVLRSDIGCAKRKYKYENGKVGEQSFYGLTDELILRKDIGAAMIRYEYDDAGRETFIRYYGTDRQPIISTKYFCAGFHYSYEEKHWGESDIWYIGVDGDPMIRQDLGYAHVHYEYDEDGRVCHEYYKDADEKPAVQKEGGYVSYLYEYDEEEECGKRRYCDEYGRPVLRKDYGYAYYKEYYKEGKCIERRYYDKKNPQDKEDKLILRKDKGYAIIKYRYDEFGQCISERFYDTEENLVISTEYQCAGFEYEYDEKGNEISITYIGTDGKPFLRGDRGFAHVKYEYDERGLLASSRYYDTTKEQLVISTKYNCAGFDYEYDESGNEIEVRYIGTDGKKMTRRDYGNARVCKRYDNVGNLLGESYYGKDNNSAVWRGRGYAFLEYTLENGNCIEEKYYDTRHMLTIRQDTGYAMDKMKYDQAGRCISKMYYDTKGNLTFSDEYDCAGFRYAYDERGNHTDTWCLGKDGNIILCRELGYAHRQYVYDDYGRVIKTAYYDVNGKYMTNLEGGYAFCECDYDKTGNCSEKRYYDINGNPVLRKDTGCAVEKFKYDEVGRCILEQFYDIWGEQSIVSTKYHCAGFSYDYDEKGNKSDIWYLDLDGEYMIRSDYGFSHVIRRYDDFGTLIGEDYFVVDHDNSDENDISYKPAVWKGRGYDSYTDVYKNGKCIESRYSIEGDLVLRQDKKYAVVKRAYDEYGQCTGVYYQGTEEQPVFSDQSYAGIQYEHNAKGEQTDTRYLGLDGKPMIRTDVGYAQIHSRYDDNGQEVEVFYWDTEGEPTAVKEGGYASFKKTFLDGRCVAQRYYDVDGMLMKRTDTGYAYYIDIYEDGNLVEEWYYDETDNLVLRSDTGYAVNKKKYNASGQCVLSVYYDTTGEKTVIGSDVGCAGFRYAYDKHGNQTDMWRLGLDGKPLVSEYWGYAHIHTDYNEIGMEVKKAYFDDNDDPAIYRAGGYASEEKKYRNTYCIEVSYYDENGNPMLNNEEGYATVKHYYNDLGLEEYRYYYGTDGQYIEGKEGSAGFQYSYDERGNQTYIYYMDVEGKYERHGDTGGKMEYKVFDEYNNLTWHAYYIYDGTECHLTDFNNLGYASVSYSYEKGLLLRVEYYDQNGNIINS